MEQQQTLPQPPAIIPTIRHDGWTGEKMAIFCETLAETAVVSEACDEAGMCLAGAYAKRRRSPVFAAAWDAALSIARERLADTLLARSMEGNVEQIWKGGEVVGERHVLDNRLGLAMLRRLDRLAETGMAVSTIGQRVTLDYQPRPTPACHPQSIDWAFAIDALRTGDDQAVARALSLTEGDEVDEVEGPPNPCSQGDDDVEELDLWHRCWRDRIDETWMTDFPPPAGFTGYESRPYDDVGDEEPYVRLCTEEEAAILDAHRGAELAAERAIDAALRDEWFSLLRTECSEADAQRRPSSTKSCAEPASGSRSDPD